MLTSASRLLARSVLTARIAAVLPTAQQAFFATQAGRCKWFDVKKGFGFIVADDDAKEVFVHQSSIHAEGFRSLAEGEPVEFEAENDDTGRPKATRVTGPNGVFVQGAPRPVFNPRGPAFGGGYGGYGGGGGNYGAGYGGGFGGGGGYGGPPQQGGYGGGYGGPGYGGGGYGGPPQQGGFGGGGYGGPPSYPTQEDGTKEGK